jgi:hypothetical protein
MQMKPTREQMIDHAALEAAHRERDARTAKAHAARLAEKNAREARKPSREELFAKQIGTYRKREEYLSPARREEERNKWFANLQYHARQDEERMRRWYDARGAGLRDG